MLRQGFPRELAGDVSAVLRQIDKTTEFPELCRYTLPDGQKIAFPYRIYWPEPEDTVISALPPVQQTICHAIFTRSHDGFVREKHLRALLAEDFPDWVIPYLVKLADEYILEIVQILYDRLRQRDCTALRTFCRENMNAFLYGHARMVSYWNCFHRENCRCYRNYVGKRLFEECFGYTRHIEKLRRRRIRTVVCFGDSNTFGFDPRSFFGSRYPASARWPDLLAEHSGWEVHCDGMNGRCIPRREVTLIRNMDLLLVMLGTNDLLQGTAPGTAAERMGRFLQSVQVSPDAIVLIAPPPMVLGEWVTPELIESSRALADHYCALSRRLGVRFLDAGRWNIPMCFDGVHFTEEGHRLFAQNLWQELDQ